MCGFIGIVNAPEVVREIHDALTAIQHRGQDAAGIATLHGEFQLHKAAGLVRDVFDPASVGRLQGRAGIGHVRYPTVGSGGDADAQPFLVTRPLHVALAHNGNVANYHELEAELEGSGRRLSSRCDAEVILHVLAQGMGDEDEESGAPLVERLEAGVRHVFQKIRGAYSVVGMLRDGTLFGFRDAHGIKPIAMGMRVGEDGPAYAIASESVVLEILRFEPLVAPNPGEMIRIDPSGRIHRTRIAEPDQHPCLFEYVYFARPDSILDGAGVYQSRIRMGRKLAARFRERGSRADIVVPIPDSARTSAMAMAQELGLPFREAVVKNRYIGRTFIMPQQGERRRSVHHKLNLIRDEFRDRSVLLVDDSIVRGTTMRWLVSAARRAGAQRVYVAIMAPPLRHPCPYGIDMSTRREFLAQDRAEEEIAEVLGADGVIYQTLEDLEDAVREGNPELNSFCGGCFTGEYPTGDITEERLRAIEADRLARDDDATQDTLPYPI